MSGARTIQEVVEAAVAGLADVDRTATGDAVELRRSGRPFARVEPGAVLFRLDRLLTPAALRTPDTSAVPFGPDWVAFAPGVVDGSAIDRATAWLEAAWRRAAPSARS